MTEDNDSTPAVAPEEKTVHQLAKLVLGAIAGFAAGKVVNHFYNAAVQASNSEDELTIDTTEA